jgi:hypothetical protein
MAFSKIGDLDKGVMTVTIEKIDYKKKKNLAYGSTDKKYEQDNLEL